RRREEAEPFGGRAPWAGRPSDAGADVDVDSAVVERYRAGFSRDVILEALEGVAFPESSRRNVRRKGDSGPMYGMCLGMTECYTGGPRPQTRAVRRRTSVHGRPSAPQVGRPGHLHAPNALAGQVIWCM
ncbi:unnamed protein product, partial [Prorocentrum cordatum]